MIYLWHKGEHSHNEVKGRFTPLYDTFGKCESEKIFFSELHWRFVDVFAEIFYKVGWFVKAQLKADFLN